MDDGEQVVSSTTEDEMSRYSQYGNHYGNNEATATFGDDDIVDLVGGAHDAIERHKASYPEDIIKFRKDEEALLTTTTERATAQLTHDEVIPDSTPSEEELAEIIPAPVILNCLDADSLPELIRPYPPAKAAPEEAGPVLEAAPEEEATAAPPAPPLVELLYWRDVKTSGVVFGAGLSLLLSLTLCSIVSVSSYIALALLSVTICFRIYKGILQAIQKSDEGHPFKLYLDQDVGLSEETVHKYSDCALARFNTTVIELRRLFLVEDLVDSLKFAVLMWILTYVGALFNGLDLLILGLVGLFSFPIIYEKYKVQIDHYVGMANKQVKDIIATVQAKVPGLKRVKAD
ncbi:reticulon-4a isoform X1 [Salvelinus namaycush]|uniref:Reticulon n=1 Tax=Salvelinus namaycush TaxID=8040 RepID=A0A8U0QNZ2_SALNM|nr:reticulon-4a isoform X1 [Salvelinus namaycush]